MDPVRDPEGNEPRKLREFVKLDHERVLEIGCGNGRMTWRYASLTRNVSAIDTDFDRLSEALQSRPDDLNAKVIIAQAKAEALPFKDAAFEGAIFAWSF